MKKVVKILIFIVLPLFAAAQNTVSGKLKNALKAAKTDSLRRELLVKLVYYYAESDREASLKYLEQGIVLDAKNGKTINLAGDLGFKGYELTHQQKLPEAYSYLQQAKMLAEDPANETRFWKSKTNPPNLNYRLYILASIHNELGLLMGATGNIDQKIAEHRQVIAIMGERGDPGLLGLANLNLASVYNSLGKLDSALLLSKKAVVFFERSDKKTYISMAYTTIASIYYKEGDTAQMLEFCRKAETMSVAQNNLTTLNSVYQLLSGYYIGVKSPDSSLFYARKAMGVSRLMGANDKSADDELLYRSYRLNHKPDSTTKYLALALAARDSSYDATVKNLADFQKLSFKTQIKLNNLENEKELARTRNRIYWFLSAIVFLAVISFVFYRNSRQKQKANTLLSEQKEEIAAQRDHLGNALENLKKAQNQLVQAEKMASLGELTAGIAHEIQNPLNFVNNFSEVSAEMIDELGEELDKGDVDEAKAIAGDIKQNLEKIRHHGKRADSIVKGMLEHSRTSAGQKEPTDLNKLADEYLRLAYHGLRAKDKSFNADLVTDFDERLPMVSVIGQDIGRVLLNLFNNAFYAVHQKEKAAGPNYKPEVSIATRVSGDNVLITVKDNGGGIPENIRDKIMQPFFTTKATGEGTGLGLSLSYDIVVKGHGGSIDVISKEGEGAKFILILPLQAMFEFKQKARILGT